MVPVLEMHRSAPPTRTASDVRAASERRTPVTLPRIVGHRVMLIREVGAVDRPVRRLRGQCRRRVRALIILGASVGGVAHIAEAGRPRTAPDTGAPMHAREK